MWHSVVWTTIGLTLPLAVCNLPARAQSQTQTTLSMAQVMTPAQLQATGVASLTASQRAELDRWLNDYTRTVFGFVAESRSGNSATVYASVGSGHWIKKVSNAGRMVELEDGSLWEINAIDRINTMLWLPITNISVLVAKTPIGDYKYTLVNKDDGETALAKYLGK